MTSIPVGTPIGMKVEERIKVHPTSYGDLNAIYTERDPGKLVVGAYCSFGGAHVMLGGEHNVDWVTTFPFCDMPDYGAEKITGHPKPMGDVTIGNDVWIGREALIMAGSTIGTGSVISARALVRGFVPPYSIVVGNPGRRIGFRFPPYLCDRLLKIAWWEWPKERIAKAAAYLMSPNVEEFCRKAENGEL